MTDQQYSRISDGPDSSQANNGRWRSEIQARVAGYKHRRGRRVEGAFSMRFPFPPSDCRQTTEVNPAVLETTSGVSEPESPVQCGSAVSAERIPGVTAVSSPSDEALAIENGDDRELLPPREFSEVLPSVSYSNPESAIGLAGPPRPRPRRKVIAFPRQTQLTSGSAGLLADPVAAEQPRILDVPEELEALPTTPFLDGLQFQPSSGGESTLPRPQDESLPFLPARISRRLQAALIDMTVTAAACLLFSAVAYRMLLDKLVIGKPLQLGGLLVAGVLWSVYQYLFLVHGGQTVGMRLTHIRLSTLEGQPVRRSRRRLRVLGLYLSAMSLGMGVLWAFVDLDALCWQDRISGTYPVIKNRL